MPIEDFFLFGTMIGVFVVVPVVAMLMHHQRKMAELIHSRKPDAQDEVLARLDHMQRQLEDVSNRQNEQIIRASESSSPAQSVEERIHE